MARRNKDDDLPTFSGDLNKDKTERDMKPVEIDPIKEPEGGRAFEQGDPRPQGYEHF